ncbi:MAG: hypothetical protein WCP22_10335 [Chlamydiota bacterium]
MGKTKDRGRSSDSTANKGTAIHFSARDDGSKQQMDRLVKESAGEIAHLRRSVFKDLQDRSSLLRTGRLWSMTEALKATEKIIGKQRLSDVPTIRLYKLRLRYLELLGGKGGAASL